MLQAVQAPLPGSVVKVRPGATETVSTTVPKGAKSAAFSSSWPGSDVVLTLVSPGGRVLQAPGRPLGAHQLAPDVQHVLGTTSELFLVSDPAPGAWTVHRYGLDVGADGEPSALVVDTAAAPNQPPTATVTQSLAGATVRLTAAASDPDGTVTGYLWDLGDGTTATTPSVTHAYAVAGTFLPTLVVTDDKGSKGYADGTAVSDDAGDGGAGRRAGARPHPTPSPPPSPGPSPTPSPSPSPTTLPTPTPTAGADQPGSVRPRRRVRSSRRPWSAPAPSWPAPTPSSGCRACPAASSRSGATAVPGRPTAPCGTAYGSRRRAWCSSRCTR